MSEKYCEMSRVRIKYDGKMPEQPKTIALMKIPSVLAERMKWQDNV
jgi:hypothetical protein